LRRSASISTFHDTELFNTVKHIAGQIEGGD
jgi:hypothetical protein